VALGQLARLSIGVGDDDVAGARPLGDLCREARGRPVGEEPGLALEQPAEVGSRTGDPVVGQRRRALEGELPPSTDPDRRVRLGERLGLDPRVLYRVVVSLERHRVIRPEGLHELQPLLEAGPALLQGSAVEGELVGLVTDGHPEDEAAAGDHVQERRVFRQPHRVIEGEDQDIRAERDARRAGGEAR
jgi:hypothetical protein